jgi:hypothetical protein
LSQAAIRTLEELIVRFERAPDISVVVFGHADKTGTEVYNLQLSQRRANAVRDYLVSRGLPQAAITTVGLGDTEPMIESVEDLLENRCVEFIFQTSVRSNSKIKILGTVYDSFPNLGKEPRGYGLYTYVLFTYYSDRTFDFFKEIIRTTQPARDSRDAGAPTRASVPRKAELNLMLIPVRQAVAEEFSVKSGKRDDDEIRNLAENSYDYPFAQEVTFAICRDPYQLAADFCYKAHGRGPYLVTHTQPITGLERIPPPYLIADFSEFNEEALSLSLNDDKEQVKRSHYTDRERIGLLRLRLVHWILHAKDVFTEIASIVPDVHEVLFPVRSKAK